MASSSVSEEEGTHLAENILKSSRDSVHFGFLRLGKYCNASDSYSFTNATCNIRCIKDERDGVAFVRSFDEVFRRGVEVMNKLNSGDKTGLKQHDKTAVKLLNNFFKEKELHEKSLKKVLDRNQRDGEGQSSKSTREIEITTALAEHLLGRLSPGQSYVIDSRSKAKGKCSCGEDHCKASPEYGSNGIGHEEVWHGYIDIILGSHEGITPESSISSTVELVETTEDEDNSDDSQYTTPIKKIKDDTNMEDFDLSPGGRTIVEVKQTAIRAENQSVAETIVFAMIQKARHPNFQNHLIPNIVIDSGHFRILMYDAQNDVFLCSVLVPIFYGSHLHTTSVIILWMVLHYRIFCSGIQDDQNKLRQVKCQFKEKVAEKWEIYSRSLKFCVSRFPPVKKDSDFFPSNEMLNFGYKF
ncbi:uncharacterized protein LOC128169833 [Crassostrea angulata]|uniref:uncharacterized protein LOC128169833 n=1 Tax=Magallana angulata TaxID=2784310 RepID=UPI0022B1F243|nr:uncharacterized protein LOC128169833 [Crassostrea angulata]